jgi:hypothetical protein
MDAKVSIPEDITKRRYPVFTGGVIHAGTIA